jgi:hypothetical protein
VSQRVTLEHHRQRALRRRQRRFAAALRADEDDEFAVANRQVDAVRDDVLVVRFANACQMS